MYLYIYIYIYIYLYLWPAYSRHTHRVSGIDGPSLRPSAFMDYGHIVNSQFIPEAGV